MDEINKLVADGKVSKAKIKYRELVEKEQDPNLERKFILFLYKHESYRDFKRTSSEFLARYPNDKEVTNMVFEYYAMLAEAAEKDERYEDAMDYIVSKLLNPEYSEMARWEKRQTEILQKWYYQVAEKGELNSQKKVLLNMKNLGFENLGKTLDPELYKTIDDQTNAN